MKCDLHLNAFSSVTVHGLVFENGVSQAQTFHRGVVKQGPLIKIGFENLTIPGGIPPRPPSKLPPPGDQHLMLSLGENLGRGRVGSVRAVNVMDSGVALPELVLKISRRRKSGSLAQEAWFYEELEQLQGVSVPRCYGFFQARLKDSAQVLTWDSNEDYDSDEDEDEAENEVKHENEDKYGYDYYEYQEGEVGKGEEGPEPYDDACAVVNEKKYVEGLPGEGRVLSFLLLERLGGNIPIRKPQDPRIQADVHEIFNDMARLGIEPLDIRWSNILSVRDDGETDTSGMICPNHGHVHRWRLIDFDLCRKSDGNLFFIDGSSEHWINCIFGNSIPSEPNLESWFE